MKAKSIKRPLALICLLITGGVAIFLDYYFDNRPLPRESYEQAVMEGKVTDKYDKNGKLYVCIGKINDYDGELLDKAVESGRIYGSLGAVCSFENYDEAPNIGERIRVEGRFSFYEGATNPGQFDVRRYYISKGILLSGYKCKITARNHDKNIFKEGLYKVNVKLGNLLEDALNEKDAGIMKAVILADKSTLDKDVKNMYSEAGIGHILAISGLHISLIANTILTFMYIIPGPIWLGMTFASASLIFYGSLVGFSPSVLRATVMFLIGIASKESGRSYDGLTALAVSSLVSVIINPLSTLGAGFMMSYLAILGIILVVPIFSPYKKKKKNVIDGFLSGLGVFLISLPVYMNNYFFVSPYNLILNMIIIPGMSILVPAGFAAIILQTVPFLPNVAAYAIHFILCVYEILVRAELKIPGALIYTGAAGWKKTFFYLAIIILVAIYNKEAKRNLYVRRKHLANYIRRHPKENVSKIRNGENKKYKRVKILTGAVLILDLILLTIPLNKTFVEFLDVGQGLCVCIHNRGKLYFFDGGSSDKNDIYEYILKPYIRYYGKNEAEAWFISHGDKDHTSGVEELLKRGEIEVKKIFIPQALSSSMDEFLKFDDVYLVSKGDRIEKDGLEFRIISPSKSLLTFEDKKESGNSDVNELSLAVLATINQKTVLLMADSGKTAEIQAFDLFSQNARADVYQVSHHGSAIDCNSKEFILKLNPKIAVISCGYDNPYNHPHKETMEYLDETNAVIYRTDYDGAVRIDLKKDLRIK